MKTFGTTPEEAKISKPLAANQGLYNGFLAIGLILGLVHPVVKFGMQIQAFFLLCIIIAAIYAGLMVKFSIVIVQGLPALIALIFLLIRW
jgi:putative membrane protein